MPRHGMPGHAPQRMCRRTRAISTHMRAFTARVRAKACTCLRARACSHNRTHVFAWACAHGCLWAHTNASALVCGFVLIRMNMHAYARTCTHAYERICMHTRANTSEHPCISIRARRCKHMHAYAKHMHAYAHTSMRTRAYSSICARNCAPHASICMRAQIQLYSSL